MTVFHSIIALLALCVILGKIQDLRERKGKKQAEGDGWVLFSKKKEHVSEEVRLLLRQEKYLYVAVRTVGEDATEHRADVPEELIGQERIEKAEVLKHIAKNHDDMEFLKAKYL